MGPFLPRQWRFTTGNPHLFHSRPPTFILFILSSQLTNLRPSLSIRLPPLTLPYENCVPTGPALMGPFCPGHWQLSPKYPNLLHSRPPTFILFILSSQLTNLRPSLSIRLPPLTLPYENCVPTGPALMGPFLPGQWRFTTGNPHLFHSRPPTFILFILSSQLTNLRPSLSIRLPPLTLPYDNCVPTGPALMGPFCPGQWQLSPKYPNLLHSRPPSLILFIISSQLTNLRPSLYIRLRSLTYPHDNGVPAGPALMGPFCPGQWQLSPKYPNLLHSRPPTFILFILSSQLTNLRPSLSIRLPPLTLSYEKCVPTGPALMGPFLPGQWRFTTGNPHLFHSRPPTFILFILSSQLTNLRPSLSIRLPPLTLPYDNCVPTGPALMGPFCPGQWQLSPKYPNLLHSRPPTFILFILSSQLNNLRPSLSIRLPPLTLPYENCVPTGPALMGPFLPGQWRFTTGNPHLFHSRPPTFILFILSSQLTNLRPSLSIRLPPLTLPYDNCVPTGPALMGPFLPGQWRFTTGNPHLFHSRSPTFILFILSSQLTNLRPSLSIRLPPLTLPYENCVPTGPALMGPFLPGQWRFTTGNPHLFHSRPPTFILFILSSQLTNLCPSLSIRLPPLTLPYDNCVPTGPALMGPFCPGQWQLSPKYPNLLHSRPPSLILFIISSQLTNLRPSLYIRPRSLTYPHDNGVPAGPALMGPFCPGQWQLSPKYPNLLHSRPPTFILFILSSQLTNLRPSLSIRLPPLTLPYDNGVPTGPALIQQTTHNPQPSP